MRKEMAKKSKADKAAAAEQLRQENAEKAKRLKEQREVARTDDDIMDEEAGQARIRLAAESKARKAAEAEALAKENAERRARLKAARDTAKTDVDITDEAAGQRRLQLAAESKARKEEEAARLRKENAEKRRRLKEQREVARTDNDINDEEAGRMRLELAKQSAIRKAEEAARLREENLALHSRLATKGNVNDSDIMDEHAGQMRITLAEESRQRKEREATKLAEENKAYFARIDDATQLSSNALAARELPWVPPDPDYRDPDARDGHITELDRKMAARGDNFSSEFPVSSWSSPDWKGWDHQSPFVKQPKPSKKTHTKNWLEWFVEFIRQRLEGLLAEEKKLPNYPKPPPKPVGRLIDAPPWDSSILKESHAPPTTVEEDPFAETRLEKKASAEWEEAPEEVKA